MDVTMIGLQNAGKTSLLRVLSVRSPPTPKQTSPAEPNTCFDRAENSPSSKRIAILVPSNPINYDTSRHPASTSTLLHNGMFSTNRLGTQLDSNSWLQYEEGTAGTCDVEMLGLGRPASISNNVGEVLPRRECNRLHC